MNMISKYTILKHLFNCSLNVSSYSAVICSFVPLLDPDNVLALDDVALVPDHVEVLERHLVFAGARQAHRDQRDRREHDEHVHHRGGA